MTILLPAGDESEAHRWPQTAIAEANTRQADAVRREINAGTHGDQAAKEQATRDIFDAMGDRQAIRTEASEGIIGLLRIAGEENPLALSSVLEQVPIIDQLILEQANSPIVGEENF